MHQPVDLLLITHNRRAYVEKAIPRLWEDGADFRVYWWDNHSTDGAIDVVVGHADERLVESQRSTENLGQLAPTRWFLEVSRSDVVGKIDDDVLLPPGWTERFVPLVRSHPELGMLSCWMYMPEDWDQDQAEKNVVAVGGHRIFRASTLGGCSFVVRTELLKRFFLPDSNRGLPVDRLGMSLAGFVSGYPLPLAFAHHMDDPRSPHCLMRDPNHPQTQFSYTMQNFGFESLEEYGRWIAADARFFLQTSFADQIRGPRLLRDRSVTGRLRGLLFRLRHYGWRLWSQELLARRLGLRRWHERLLPRIIAREANHRR